MKTDTRSPLIFRIKIRRQRRRQCRYNWWWDRSEDRKRWDAVERWCRAVLMDGQLKETWWYSFNQFINTTMVYILHYSITVRCPFFFNSINFLERFFQRSQNLKLPPTVPFSFKWNQGQQRISRLFLFHSNAWPRLNASATARRYRSLQKMNSFVNMKFRLFIPAYHYHTFDDSWLNCMLNEVYL